MSMIFFKNNLGFYLNCYELNRCTHEVERGVKTSFKKLLYSQVEYLSRYGWDGVKSSIKSIAQPLRQCGKINFRIADGISIPKLKKLSTAGTRAKIGLGNHNATHKQHEEKKIAPKKNI